MLSPQEVLFSGPGGMRVYLCAITKTGGRS